jgi:hypothetical protein
MIRHNTVMMTALCALIQSAHRRHGSGDLSGR